MANFKEYLDKKNISYTVDANGDITVNRGLDLSNANIKELPNNLTVNGGLYISNTNIKELPNNLKVSGGLYLSNTNIKELPDSLKVNGFLDISYTDIKELPNNLKVSRGLNICHTNIKELPDNLTVGEDLDISNTGITELPDTLNCGSLYLDHKNITNIAYREKCGKSGRTIFAVNTLNGVMVRAGCFLNTLTEFEIAVDLKYTGEAAETYKTAARECVAELTAMLNVWAV